MFRTLLFISACLFFSACQSANQQLLVGTWKAKSLNNPVMEKSIATALADIDTFGNTDEIAKDAVNIDSFKSLSKQLLQADIEEQQKALQNITYTFSNNGIAYISDGNSTDSALWTVNKANQLSVDAPALTGIGDLQLFFIKNISDKLLTLQMSVGTDTSEMILEKIK
jgi:hypothetical protein